MDTVGVFRDVESAGRGVEGLLGAGFTEAQITSLTSVPYPDGVLVKSDRHTRFRWLTPAAGLAGAAAGFLLAAGTAWLYPVQTGDKPIIALYPTGIVTFEVTMLFALIGTMAGMFLDMKLPSWRKRPYDPAIAEGCIGISVSVHAGGETVMCGPEEQPGECIGGIAALPAGEQYRRAGEIMRDAGAFRVIAEEAP
jgi:Alternative complex III, ActD subunit